MCLPIPQVFRVVYTKGSGGEWDRFKSKVVV